jgi:hypothetical protein
MYSIPVVLLIIAIRPILHHELIPAPIAITAAAATAAEAVAAVVDMLLSEDFSKKIKIQVSISV